MDADRLIFACALPAERRAARHLGRTELVGMACVHGIPDEPVVSFGIAGGLREDLPIGTVIDASRVVDESGAVLWEGEPLGVRGARPGTILGASRIVDDPAERALLRERTGADAVDMESGLYARAGTLAGCIRAISDTPSRTLGPLAQAFGPDGRVAVGGLVRALVGAPRDSVRAIRDIRTAFAALGAVA